jgi:hypothetical protein
MTENTPAAVVVNAPFTSTSPAVPVKHRIVCALATRGQLGKSTENIARAEWMRQRDVPVQGFDLVSRVRNIYTYTKNAFILEE